MYCLENICHISTKLNLKRERYIRRKRDIGKIRGGARKFGGIRKFRKDVTLEKIGRTFVVMFDSTFVITLKPTSVVMFWRIFVARSFNVPTPYVGHSPKSVVV